MDGARQHFDYQIRENEIFELRHCETEMDRACMRERVEEFGLCAKL